MMKIQKHPDYLIFAQDSKSGELLDFPDVLRGWGITIDQTASKPPMEWMNGAFNRIDKNMLYLLQQGVPEWSEQVFYPVNAIIKYNGIIYIAKVENESANPVNNVNKWTKLIPDASTEHKGIVQLSSAIDSESESQAATAGAVKKAYDMANKAKLTAETDATTTAKGRVQLSSAVDSTSEALAATPKAVKTAMDKANSAASAASTAQTTANTANSTANTAKTNAATAQTKADSAYTLANTANTTANVAKYTAETDATTSAKGRVQLNSAVNSTVENQAATPRAVKDVYDFAKNALNNFIGVNQKWFDVTNERLINIIYTNTTKKPIFIHVVVWSLSSASAVDATLFVDDVSIKFGGGGVGHNGAWKMANANIIVPANSKYKLNITNGTVFTWLELR